MVARKRREMGFPLRWYSIPNVFRYERPQRGRLREHWQFNADIFGSPSPVADAEIMLLAHSLMRAFGATDEDFIIKLGSRNFLDSIVEELDLSPQHAKALRHLLDRKNKITRQEFTREVEELGIAVETLSPKKVPSDVAEILALLKYLGVSNAQFDPAIVRGFDYYSGVVFEVFDTHPENRRAMFGGGRYDNLTALFDAEELPAVGFAAGDVTFKDFLSVRGLLPEYLPNAKVYIAIARADFASEAMRLAGELRKNNVSTAVDFGDKKLSEQIKAAVRHGIPYLIVFGEDELVSQSLRVKDLASGKETVLARGELSSFFTTL
jgi:histidyl-tRNA synthetase